MCQTREKRPLTPFGMVEACHGEELAVDGVVRLVQHRAHRRHLGVFQHRIPARFFVLNPVAYTLAVLFAHRCRDVINTMAASLAQCHHTQAFTLATAVQQGMELRAQALADGRRHTKQFAREFVEGVAQAQAQTCLWKQRPHAADGAVKAIGQDTSHLVRRLMRESRALKHAIRLGECCGTFGGAVAQVPEDTAFDDRGQVDPLGETMAVFLIGQDRRGQRQATPGQHRNQTRVSQGTDHAIEGHRRDGTDGGTPCQAQAAMGGDQGLAGCVRPHRSITPDEVWQDGEDRLACGALEAPNGEATQTHACIMGVAGQTATAGTGGLVGQLEADREDGPAGA